MDNIDIAPEPGWRQNQSHCQIAFVLGVRSESKLLEEGGLSEGLVDFAQDIFETLAATLLSIMAIVLTIAEISAVRQQNRLVEAQLKVAESDVEPIIIVSSELEYDDAKEYFSNQHLVIKNYGAPALEASIEVAVLLSLRIESKAGDNSKKIVVAPYNFYGATIHTQDSTGLLFTVKGSHNNRDAGDFERGFRAFADEKGYFGNANFQTYTKVTYTSILGKTSVKYSKISDVTGQIVMSESDGKASLTCTKKFKVKNQRLSTMS